MHIPSHLKKKKVLTTRSLSPLLTLIWSLTCYLTHKNIHDKSFDLNLFPHLSNSWGMDTLTHFLEYL